MGVKKFPWRRSNFALMHSILSVENMKKFKASKKNAASAGRAKMKELSRDAKDAAPTLN